MKKYIILLALLLVSACGEPTQSLEDRTKQLLDAMVANNWKSVYALRTEDFRKSTPEDRFLSAQRKIKFVRYRIDGMKQIDDKTAEVTVIWDIMMQGYEFKDAKRVLRWVKENGQWHVMVGSDKQFGFNEQEQPKAQ